MNRILPVFLFISILAGSALCEDVSYRDIAIDVMQCCIQNEEFQNAKELPDVLLKFSWNKEILNNDTIIDALHCFLRKCETQISYQPLATLMKMEAEGFSEYDTGIETVKNYIREGNLVDAEGVLRKMLKQYPDNIELISILARILFWQKRYDKSIEEYNRALRLRDDESLRKELLIRPKPFSLDFLSPGESNMSLVTGWVRYI